VCEMKSSKKHSIGQAGLSFAIVCILTLLLSLVFSDSVLATSICVHDMAELAQADQADGAPGTPDSPDSVVEVKENLPTSLLSRLVERAMAPFAKFRPMSFGPKSDKPFTIVRFLPNSLKALRESHFDFETSNNLLSRAKAITLSVLKERGLISDKNLRALGFNFLFFQKESWPHQRDDLNAALAIVNRQLDEELRNSLESSDQRAHRFLLSRTFWIDGEIKRVRFVDSGGGRLELEATLASRSRASTSEVSTEAIGHEEFFASFGDPVTQRLTSLNSKRVRQLPDLIVKDIQDLMAQLSSRNVEAIAALVQEGELSLEFFKLIRGIDSEDDVRVELLSRISNETTNATVNAINTIVDRMASRSRQLHAAVKFFVPAAKGGEASVQRIEQAEHINTVSVPENARYFLRADGRSVGAKGMLEIFQKLRAQGTNESPDLTTLSLSDTAARLESDQQGLLARLKETYGASFLGYLITGDEVLVWLAKRPELTPLWVGFGTSLRFSAGSLMDAPYEPHLDPELQREPQQLSIRDQGLLSDIAEKALKIFEAGLSDDELNHNSWQLVSIFRHNGKIRLEVLYAYRGIGEVPSEEMKARLEDFVERRLIPRLVQEFPDVPEIAHAEVNIRISVWWKNFQE